MCVVGWVGWHRGKQQWSRMYVEQKTKTKQKNAGDRKTSLVLCLPLTLLENPGVPLFPLRPLVKFIAAADVAAQRVLVRLVASVRIELELSGALRELGDGSRIDGALGATSSQSVQLLLYGAKLRIGGVAGMPSDGEALPIGKSLGFMVVVACSKVSRISGVWSGCQRGLARAPPQLLILLEGGVKGAVNDATLPTA